MASEHELETAWTLWDFPRIPNTKLTTLCKQQITKTQSNTTEAAADVFGRDLKPLGTFYTAEQFFKAWSQKPKPSDVGPERNIGIFRMGLRPMWEEFPNGGRFVIRIRKGGSLRGLKARGGDRTGRFADIVWENLVYRTIGEAFAFPELVGVVCSVRSREFALSVWLSTGEHLVLRSKIREALRELLAEAKRMMESEGGIFPNATIQFDMFQFRLREQQIEILKKVLGAVVDDDNVPGEIPKTAGSTRMVAGC